ncbi:hypothetical protein MYIN104542_03130 [Mycobacterium intermedium]
MSVVAVFRVIATQNRRHRMVRLDSVRVDLREPALSGYRGERQRQDDRYDRNDHGSWPGRAAEVHAEDYIPPRGI